ncbi:MAG TPA: hypothetical protein VGO48_05195 [Conexibacter sp.]|jgi:hypothetical protein|nr:hypothetical protein [Conexibacter sp.]
MRRRPFTLSLVLSVAALTALVVLGVVVLAPSPLRAPAGSTAAVPDSQLVRKYPLGERPLCCGPDTAARNAASPSAAARVLHRDSAKGSGYLEWLALVLTLTLAAALGSFTRRFTRVDGAWVRVHQRRRLQVGLTIYRSARLFGFHYSDRRGALVFWAFDGRFGPVLTLRPHPPAPPQHATARAPLRTSAGRSFASSPACTIDVAFRLLPHQHRGAQLWQLTAVDLRSRFVWTELVRRRSGPPAAPELSAFLRRVAGELGEAGEHLDAVAAPVRALPVLDGVALPAGVRLIVAEPVDARTATAADIHELLVVRHWRTAFIPPAAPSLDDLRCRLQTWTASYNAQRDEAPSLHIRLPSRG